MYSSFSTYLFAKGKQSGAIITGVGVAFIIIQI